MTISMAIPTFTFRPRARALPVKSNVARPHDDGVQAVDAFRGDIAKRNAHDEDLGISIRQMAAQQRCQTHDQHRRVARHGNVVSMQPQGYVSVRQRSDFRPERRCAEPFRCRNRIPIRRKSPPPRRPGRPQKHMMEFGKAMVVNQTEHFMREHDELIPPFEFPFLRASLGYFSLAEMVARHCKRVQGARQLSSNMTVEIPLSIPLKFATRSQSGEPLRRAGHARALVDGSVGIANELDGRSTTLGDLRELEVVPRSRARSSQGLAFQSWLTARVRRRFENSLQNNRG